MSTVKTGGRGLRCGDDPECERKHDDGVDLDVIGECQHGQDAAWNMRESE